MLSAVKSVLLNSTRTFKNFGHKREPTPTFTFLWHGFLTFTFIGLCIEWKNLPRDATRCEKWVKKIRLLRKETDWLPTKSSIICSKHFRDQDKVHPKNNGGRVYLSNDVVPMLFINSMSLDSAVLAYGGEDSEMTSSQQPHRYLSITGKVLRIATYIFGSDHGVDDNPWDLSTQKQRDQVEKVKPS